MKIVFIIDSLRRHGTQRFLTHLARGLANLGYQQKVVVLNNACHPGIAAELESAGATITVIGKWALLFAGFGCWRLVQLLRRERPDIVVTMLDFADTLGRPAARIAGCRVLVSSVRVRNIIKPIWQRWLDRMTVGWVEKVVVNSSYVSKYITEHEGVRPAQIIFIPNGVEDLRAHCLESRHANREKLGIGPDTILLGAVSRLERQKNVSLLLKACAALQTKRSWKVIIIGDGAERRQLRELARALKLTEQVVWLGEREDVGDWMAAMDIFVHTADFEGMPNAVMEAMATGLPVIASAVDGNLELIRHDVSGYLVPVGDFEAFARRIDELIAAPNRAQQFGEQAHRDVLERFGMARMIERYHGLFLSLAEEKSAR